MTKHILTLNERIVIQALRRENFSLQHIANRLGFSKTTIFNELHRIPGEYDANLADEMQHKQVSLRGRKNILTDDLKLEIEDKIKNYHWSPEQIAHRLNISFKSIYNWINDKLLDLSEADLPDKGVRRHRSKETRGQFSNGRSIDKRPDEVAQRDVFGHFEADTVLSGKNKGQALGTFVERVSRLMLVERLDSRNSQSMTETIIQLAKSLGSNMKTLTVDHGKEFAGYQTIESETDVRVYFAHAYSPHERGTNENRNKLLRRFVPKGRRIEDISDEELAMINWKLNTMPLKCLNWKTPLEVFMANFES